MVKVNNVFSPKILLFIIIICAMVILQMFLSGKIVKHEIVEQDLIDECGKTLNDHIMHTIVDEASCQLGCRNFCNTLEMDFKEVTFFDNHPACNNCKCICR